jgi:hypothetical protein
MGIRIHKTIGYAIIDLDGPDDNRLSKNIQKLMDYLDYTDYGNVNRFKSYLLKLPLSNEFYDFERNLAIKSLDNKFNFYDHIIYNGEMGLKNVLLFIPFDCEHWKRYDNIIDYYEEINNNMTTYIKEIKCGIYPYNSSYVDKLTGKPFNEKNSIVHTIVANPDIYDKTTKIKDFPEGINTIQDVLDRATPEIPITIVWLCKFLNIFKDEKTINEMKPIIYTYWS